MSLYGVWFGGRRTCVVVNAPDRSTAITKARAGKVRGGENVEGARLLTEAEAKQARAGNWIRTGKDGQPPGYNPSKKGHGPEPKG
jgi:hypothetical protein